jgi:AraC-like DNA-binding protein
MRKCFSYLLLNILLPSLLLIHCAVSFAQENDFEFVIPDSLQSKSYEEIQAAFDASRKDLFKRKLYASTYLKKAILEDVRLKQVIGYELLGRAYKGNIEKKILFYDKSIALCKGIDDFRYPAILYTRKGTTLYVKGDYEEAFENYLKAIEYAENKNNTELFYINKYNIGIIKKRLELYDEALTIFKECYEYELNNPERAKIDFVYSHYSLADIYTEMYVTDSAKKYSAKGYKLALEGNFDFAADLFALNKGILLFLDKKYAASITQLKEAVLKLKDAPDKLQIINGLFHIGKAYDSLQNKTEAIRFYKKVDSVFSGNLNHISSNVLKSYEALYTHYRKNNNKSSEAYYIQKTLLATDISKNDYRTLINQITKKFDRRELLLKQKRLNEALVQKDKKYTSTIFIAVIIAIIFMIVVVIFYTKQKRIKKRFQEFVKNHEKTQNATQKNINVPQEEIQKIGLADDIIEQILLQLDDFETSQKFIKPDITLPSLSKQFKTNSAYLSKVINTYKNKKFAAYLNDLRVEYAIQKIQSDKHFHLYTIKAIALEVGFNNSQSFARAFKRKTGIQPSDFIKQSKIIRTAKNS